MKFFDTRTAKAGLIAICLAAFIFAARFWYLEEQGNFHPITHGEAYRSAQLDKDELAYYIKSLGIRSVINLRGRNENEAWYREETAVCRKLNTLHYDHDLSADKAPDAVACQALLNTFRQAPRPVLIHCRAGADRSGLAAALWQVVVDGADGSSAGKQLSIRYGHLPFGPTQTLDAFFDQWVAARKIKSNAKKMAGEPYQRIQVAG